MTNFFLYILVCIIWGTTWMAIKIGLNDAPPLWSLALRCLVATSILWAVNIVSGQKYPQGWRNKWRVAWPGIFSYLGSYICTYLGSQYISSGLASILFSTFPFFVMALMTFMLKGERISLRSIIGAIVGFVGIIFIFAEPLEYGDNAVLGMSLMLLSPISAAVGMVSIKKYLADEDVFPMVTLQMTLGTALVVATALLFDDWTLFKVTYASIGALLYLSIFGSVVAFTSYYWLLKRLSMLTMSMIALITPLLALIVGYVVLDEVLTSQDYAGTAMVLAGVAIVNLKSKAH